ncbi:MAG: hypothetical protein JKY45_13505 [Emcibacter sp.]|nr:hypothetical protein [Emcibacter sp.]
MKITVDIDCTPEEARSFLGLPDVKPLQEAFMATMNDKISSGLSSEDMEKLFDLWMTPGLKQAGQNMEMFQNMFWNAAKSK